MMKFTTPRVTKFVSGGTLGDRQIRAVLSDATPDRQGDVLEPDGCDLSSFRSNNVVLANHNPSSPIGNADATIRNGQVQALITFAPKGASNTADEFCALTKAGVLRAMSVGFEPIEFEPLRATGGRRYKKWSLLECSVVSVPANPSALIVERGLRAMTGTLARQNGSMRSPSRSVDHLGEIEKCIKSMSGCHEKAADLHDAVHETLTAWARHGTTAGDRANALRHWVNSQPYAPPAMREHVDEIERCMRSAAQCYEKSTRLGDDLHDQLEEWQDHGTSAGTHARALRNGGGHG